MPPRQSWSSLLPGVLALAVLLAVVIGVLAFSGIGKMRGDTVRLYVLADQAHGVMPGTEVWLFGQKVGVVERITFREPSADTAGRVVLALEVREDVAASIRRDAPASIRTGANIMGPIVVYLDAGTAAQPAVREGDTLRAGDRGDLQLAAARLSDATAQVPGIMADARTVMAHVSSRRGPLAAFASGETGRELSRLRGHVARVRMSPAVASMDDVMGRAGSAMARADSIRSLLRSGTNVLGRFRRDSTLATQIASVRDELASLRALLDTADGTLRRWNTDSAILRSLADAQREMALLFDDVRRRPIRYFPF